MAPGPRFARSRSSQAGRCRGRVRYPRAIMRILILGGDGYLGWPTAMRFSAAGHEVAVVDNLTRRLNALEVGAASLTPILTLHERIAVWREHTGSTIAAYIGDVTDPGFVDSVFAEFDPETVVH